MNKQFEMKFGTSFFGILAVSKKSLDQDTGPRDWLDFVIIIYSKVNSIFITDHFSQLLFFAEGKRIIIGKNWLSKFG